MEIYFVILVGWCLFNFKFTKVWGDILLKETVVFSLIDTRAKRLHMRKVSIFKIAVANANFTTRTPFFELKANFISIHWSFSLFALTELSKMMTKTATMATAKCCQSERGLSKMIFAFGARRKVCGAKERN